MKKRKKDPEPSRPKIVDHSRSRANPNILHLKVLLNERLYTGYLEFDINQNED